MWRSPSAETRANVINSFSFTFVDRKTNRWFSSSCLNVNNIGYGRKIYDLLSNNKQVVHEFVVILSQCKNVFNSQRGLTVCAFIFCCLLLQANCSPPPFGLCHSPNALNAHIATTQTQCTTKEEFKKKRKNSWFITNTCKHRSWPIQDSIYVCVCVYA